MTSTDDSINGFLWSEPRPLFRVEIIDPRLGSNEVLTTRQYDSEKLAALNAFTMLGFPQITPVTLTEDQPVPAGVDIVIRRVADTCWQILEGEKPDGVKFTERRTRPHSWRSAAAVESAPVEATSTTIEDAPTNPEPRRNNKPSKK